MPAVTLKKDVLYNTISNLIESAKMEVAQSVNYAMVHTYFLIGKMIVEHLQKGNLRASYSKETIQKLSSKLSRKFGKGFSVDNLESMRKFYVSYQFRISETVSRKSIKPVFTLSWSHYVRLLRIDNPDERNFYEIESTEQQWSVRELQRQYDAALYERLVLSKNKKKVKQLATKGQIIAHADDVIKEPLVLEFLGLKPAHSFSENDLETAIISKLQDFLLELGKGFTFVARQQRITFDGKHFHIDLVFYNRLLKSFVLIDLKIGDLEHKDIGQMQMYVNYYDRKVKMKEENKTIGIILCKDKSDVLVEYTLPQENKQIFASKYQLVLPKKAELKKLLNS
jgi:predicted nuclease of restriction endonuclease-like (RecB) superfamily